MWNNNMNKKYSKTIKLFLKIYLFECSVFYFECDIKLLAHKLKGGKSPCDGFNAVPTPFFSFFKM